jgi:hypothetical protein
MTTNQTIEKEGRSRNTGLAKVAVQCYADTFVVNQSLVLRINIYGERRPPSPSPKPMVNLFQYKTILIQQNAKHYRRY